MFLVSGVPLQGWKIRFPFEFPGLKHTLRAVGMSGKSSDVKKKKTVSEVCRDAVVSYNL